MLARPSPLPPRPGANRRRALWYWGCQIGGWGSWAIIGVLYSLIGGAYAAWWQITINSIAYVVLEVIVMHLYRNQIRRRGWARLGLRALLPRTVAASVGLGIVMPSLIVLVYLAVSTTHRDLIGFWTIPTLLSEIWCVMIWNVAYFGIHYFERGRELELDNLHLAVAAAEGRLHGLMSQLNPHFLFNCLNSVRALILENPQKAQAAVTALSEMMRYSMQAGRIVTVPLATEIDMVETYLSLEAVRLEERLQSELDIADDTRDATIPTMLVQLLVENGVKHGIERIPDGGTIHVASWRDATTLRVRVTNTGRIAPRTGSTGVGLANAHERLRLLYGGRASLALREDGSSVIADLAVPLSAPQAATA